MALTLSILYRGPLSSCNYDCGYCPFAKRRESAAELDADRLALGRFVDWAERRPAGDSLRVLFTPWGEALTRKWYQTALARLCGMAHVEKAAIQTNLSAGLSWLDGCDLSKLALWATYHPTQVSRETFLSRCRELSARGVAYSAGAVGTREHFGEIEALRAELPVGVYLWVNAYKDVPDYYTAAEAAWLGAVDPHFRFNNARHPSRGRPCRTGEHVISVDGNGDVRRCHFVKEVIGNLYEPGVEAALRERPCPNATCGCYIGYVHMPDLGQAQIFGDRLLERIPLHVSASGR